MASSQLEQVDLGSEWLQVRIENDQLQRYITTKTQTSASLLVPQRLTCFHGSNLLGKMPEPRVVNALLAYSKGQLALAPCTDCLDSYDRHGSAMPFPDCVFLPDYWGFACASCIARNRAVKCSFYIYRTEYRDHYWTKVRVRTMNLSPAGSKWLEKGHPLSPFSPESLYTIWKHRQQSGASFDHELAQTLQEPSFVYPPNVPRAMLPNDTPGMSAFRLSHARGHLSALKDEIKTKRNIFVITGAGISTNTGIPDYQSSARSKKSSRNVYDASAYSTTESAKELNDDVLHKLRCGLTAPFTPFDTFLEHLARSNRLRRHYTQNIDCRHTRSQFLTQRTTWLHGRADTLMCHLRPSHTMQVTPQVFQRSVMNICPVCKKEQTERAKAGKRMRAVGILRPKVLLYGESCPDETEITAALNSDLEEPIDAVLIVGTRLSIPSVFNFTKRLCEVVAGRPEGLVVWVSKEPPRIDDTFRAYIGVEYIGDCDDFARMISG